VNRKGAKTRRFDHRAFAEKYGVDIHWIFRGDLCAHPRDLKRVKDGQLEVAPRDGNVVPIR
jgi:hypothetical protein